MDLDTFYGVVVRKNQEDRKMSRIWVGISVCVYDRRQVGFAWL